MHTDIEVLQKRRDSAGRAAHRILMEAKNEGRETLTYSERGQYEAALFDLKDANEELERRGQITATLDNLSERIYGKQPGQRGQQPGAGSRTAITRAGALAPLRFGEDELRRLQTAAQRGESCRVGVETRNFSTADGLMPSSLFPYPVAAEHEGRLLDYLPGYSIDMPAISFIRHVSTTGAAAATAEGAEKPEVVFNTDALTATAVKIAAHVGLSWEIVNDWPAFQSYCGTELFRQVIETENAELIQGDAGTEFTGTTVGAGPSGMTGLMNTSGILTHNAETDTGTAVTALDSVEIAMAQLRTGPALAVADLLVLHPETWSALRRIKDQYGHFMVQPDPTAGQASELWGVPVVQTTQQPLGYGLLIDSSKFGYVAVREPLAMRIGYSGTDFTQNVVRYVGEERLILAVTRPPAVMLVSGLPAS